MKTHSIEQRLDKLMFQELCRDDFWKKYGKEKMKTKSCKQKARVLQDWVRDKIREIFNLKEDDVTSRTMGCKGEDILLSPEARKVFPFSVECKNQERLNLWNSYAQTVSNTVEDNEPLLFIKRNYHKPLVVLDAEYFLYLNREINILKFHEYPKTER